MCRQFPSIAVHKMAPKCITVTIIIKQVHAFPNYLCLSRKRLRETLHVLRKVTLVLKELHICTIDLDLAGILLVQVLLATKRGEAPVLADDDLLAARELVL
jgi:hypothetical protein